MVGSARGVVRRGAGAKMSWHLRRASTMSFFMLSAAFLPTLRSQSSLGTSQNPFGSYSEAQCEQMNKQRAIDLRTESIR